jgi:hypothetical protein
VRHFVSRGQDAIPRQHRGTGSVFATVGDGQIALGGELPAVDTIETLNRILELLVMGLWNDLTRHQKRSEPFRLTRLSFSEDREGLSRLARIRIEELDGFADGLFGPDDELDLPDRAHASMDRLGELRAAIAIALRDFDVSIPTKASV